MAMNSAFNQQFLWFAFFIWGHNNLCMAVSKEESDVCGVSNGQPVSFYNCAKDCSQEDFKCTIGGLEEVERFKHDKNPLYKPAEGFLDPPRLLDISYQMVLVIKSQGDSEDGDLTGSIYIQFLLPQAINSVVPGAIQLYFQGIDEDDYYFKCPRQRIFRFDDYKPNTTEEMLKPRNISYNCFYGVDSLHESSNYAKDYHTKFKKGYTLGLKSHPGRRINYTITINAISPMIPRSQWIPTIATSLNITNCSLLVLVEKEQSDIQVYYSYAYLLLSTGTVHRSVQLNKESREGFFENLTRGRFTVMVNITGIYNGEQMHWSGETIKIDATQIPEAYPLHYADLNMGSLKIISVVLGCSIGVALLIFFAVVVYRRREWKKIVYCNSKSSGIILHPFDKTSTPEFFEFVECYETLVEKHCSCALLSWKQLRSRSTSKIKAWLENDFRNVSFIIVFYNRNLYDRKNVAVDSYSMVLQEVDKQRNIDSSLLTIIPIKMPGSVRPPTLIEQISTVNWDDFEKLYCKIHHLMHCPENKREFLTEKWRSSDYGKSLMEKFGKLELETDIETGRHSETDEDLYDANNLANNQRPEIDKENSSDAKENFQEYAESVDMNKFAMGLNKENDSVIGEICKKKRNARMDLNRESSRSKEYNTQTSIHSIKADVHSGSFNDTVLKHIIDSSHQLETNDEEKHLRNSDKSHSLSASNGSKYSDRSEYERTGSQYKNGVPGNHNWSPPFERRPDFYLSEKADTCGQYRQGQYVDHVPYHLDDSMFYGEEPHTGDTYIDNPTDPNHQNYPPYHPQYVYQHPGGQHYGEYDQEQEYQEHHPLINGHFNDSQYQPNNGRHYNIHDNRNKPELFLPPRTSSPPSMYMPSNYNDVCQRFNRNPAVNRQRNPDLHHYIGAEPQEEVPLIRNPCEIIRRNPNHAETVNQGIHFRAHDHQPSYEEFRSRSRTNEVHIPHYRSEGDIELEDMKSVSQQHINEVGFVSPAHSDHSIGESIASQDQEAELMNINKSSLPRNSDK